MAAKTRTKHSDVPGLRFGKLTVSNIYDPETGKWRCDCACGNSTWVSLRNLKHPKRPIRTCGSLLCRVNGNARPALRKEDLVPSRYSDRFDCIFAIGDTHFPYGHVDALDFIRAILKAYKPDKTVHMGDESDMHAMSFHEHNPNLPGPKDETDQAAAKLQELHQSVREMDLLESNHGSLHLRKSITAGIPERFVRSYNDAWEVGPGWKWHFDLTLQTSKGPVNFHHARGENVLRVAQMRGQSCVQGHHHNLMGVQHFRTDNNLGWGAQTGCLIDWEKLAFKYGRNDLKKPLLGSLVILRGDPLILPMNLDHRGRWDKTLLKVR